MKKVLIIILILLIPAQTYTMFSFWFNNKPSIEKTKNLKQRAESLLAKNSSNLPLKIYLDSIADKDIDRSNYSKISANLKTLLFPGNTYIPERFMSASSQNIAPASWLNPLSWRILGSPQQRFVGAIYEIPEIVSDTSFSLGMSDAAAGLVSMIITDKLVRNNGNNSSMSTLLLAPLYVVIPIAVICFKKCRFDMNSILLNNNEYLVDLDAQKTRANQTQVQNLEDQNQNLHQNVQRLTAQQVEQAAQAQERLEQERKTYEQTCTKLRLSHLLDNRMKSMRQDQKINELNGLVNNLNQINKSLLTENNQLRNETSNEIDEIPSQIYYQAEKTNNINLSVGVIPGYVFAQPILAELDKKSKCCFTTSNNIPDSINLQSPSLNSKDSQQISYLKERTNSLNESEIFKKDELGLNQSSSSAIVSGLFNNMQKNNLLRRLFK